LLGHIGRIGVHDLPQQKLCSNRNDFCFQSLSLPSREFDIRSNEPLSFIEAVFICQAKEVLRPRRFIMEIVIIGSAQMVSAYRLIRETVGKRTRGGNGEDGALTGTAQDWRNS
ncbi:MAG: hypothetical protein WCK00_07585, partial [Deltaproteobacteria bacterium]